MRGNSSGTFRWAGTKINRPAMGATPSSVFGSRADLVPVPPDTVHQHLYHWDDEGEGDDVVRFAVRLYDRLPARDPSPVWQALEAVLGGGLGPGWPVGRLVRTGNVARIDWGAGRAPVDVVLPAGIVHPRSHRMLVALERLGQAILRHDAAWPATAPHARSPADYRRWAEGGADAAWGPVPWRATADSPATALLRWFACQHAAGGAVAWVWSLSLLFCALCPGAAAGHGVVAHPLAACPDAAAWRPAPTEPRADLCGDLPAGCGLTVHHWGAGTWWTYRALAEHLARACCFETLCDWGHPDRPRARRHDHRFPIDPDTDALVVLVAGGGWPLGLLAYCHEPGAGRTHCHVPALCAVTRSRGGSLLLGWLKRRTRRITLEAGDDLAGFYARHGFVRGDHDGGLWVWPAPGAGKRERGEGTDGGPVGGRTADGRAQ